MRAEALRGYPLEDILRALGYRRDPADSARWRCGRSAVSVNGFMFYDHLHGDGGSGAIDLALHAQRCSLPEAIDFLARLPPRNRRPPTPCPDRRWLAAQRYLVEKRGIGDALVTLCRDLGLIHADRRGNLAFVRRNAAGKTTGIESISVAPGPDKRGGFWLSWNLDWPRSVILAGNALDALSILSLQLVPARRAACAVVSTGTTDSLPGWIGAWNPARIFCAYDATPQGHHAANRIARRDNRTVRLRPVIEGGNWNDMLIRDRAGEPIGFDDRTLD